MGKSNGPDIWAYGLSKEQEFAALFDEVTWATKEQDMFEHWDMIVEGHKVDVKARKKVSRRDADYSDKYNWVELRNVRGNKGWLFGQADAIVFEMKDSWIFVRVKDLQEFIKIKLNYTYVSNPHYALYQLYSRGKDAMTLVLNDDLKKLAFKTKNKA